MQRCRSDSLNTDSESSMNWHISRFANSSALYSRRSSSMSNRSQPPAIASSTVTICRHCASSHNMPRTSASWLVSIWMRSAAARPRFACAPLQNAYASCVTLDGVLKYVLRQRLCIAMPEATLFSSRNFGTQKYSSK
ncbi:Uncharacterised protein [Burkholderia pseudomallei]|nr:Uncharacterised protein [Burkholderia pseudomallei]